MAQYTIPWDRRMSSRQRPIRIGAVQYLNSKPLIEGLRTDDPEYELVMDYPSRLAERLMAGELDVGLIPSIECLRDGRYCVVSDACVACFGPVRSVKLHSRVPISRIRTLALDEGSRTSAALVRILLAERLGLRPRTSPFPCGAPIESVQADAVLVIGDRAFHPPPPDFVESWDLGEVWSNWTGLPFVFALWAARPDAPLERLSRLLTESRDVGVQRLNRIAQREAPRLSIPLPVAEEYLLRNLHFRLGERERESLGVFRRLAVQHKFILEGADLEFYGVHSG